MNYKVCCFNNRFLVLIEVPRTFVFRNKNTVNFTSLRQTTACVYPNFVQKIAIDLERLAQQYNIVAILYKNESTIMNNFPNGAQNNITYYVYYTNLYDCMIDNVFYDELLTHLVRKVKMTPYAAQVFLHALRNGFNKPEPRIESLIDEHSLKTQPDSLDEIRQLVLNLRADQKDKIETLIAKNSTFNSILPNMLLLKVTNCTQQESLSIKHSSTSSSTSSAVPVVAQKQRMDLDGDDEDEDNEEMDYEDGSTTTTATTTTAAPLAMDTLSEKIVSFDSECKQFKQHYYYCSYGEVEIVEARIQMSTFNTLVLKNIIVAFVVKAKIDVDSIHCYLYVDVNKFKYFSKLRVQGKILQFKRHKRYTIDPLVTPLRYDIDFDERKIFFSSASIVIEHLKASKDAFKPKIKTIKMYLVVCENKLHRILSAWSCICKIIRVITSPFNEQSVFYHVLLFVNEYDTDLLYDFLPDNGMDNTPCPCHDNVSVRSNIKLPHAQKLWLARPCIEMLFHTHFDWTILKIQSDFQRRPDCVDIFRLYDIFESGKTKIAKLLDAQVFKVTIENLTTFKFYNETGLLYPFEASGHEELYVYTLLKMTRIVYRCILLPLTKLERLTAKNLIPSKYPLTYAFIDDPLTPTTSVRGPQSTRNLKSVEDSERMFDTKVINVTMLMNSFNLCGSEDIENTIKI